MKEYFLKKKKQISKFVDDKLCPKCKNELVVDADYKKCTRCNHNFVMTAKERIELICDKDTFSSLNFQQDIECVNNDFKKKIEYYQNKTQLDEAVIVGTAKINGIEVALGVMDANFLCGTVGVVVGELIVKLIEYATLNRLPLLFFSASGGIRVQEGVKALVQMAKISSALEDFDKNNLLFISYVTNPTMGGLNASLATIGDIIIAEEDCTIGFTGSRVIRDILHEELPEGFQSTDFNLSNGAIDLIVDRENSKKVIYDILRKFSNKSKLQYIKHRKINKRNNVDVLDIYSSIRSGNHIRNKDIVDMLFNNKIFLHGDRINNEDSAIECCLCDFNSITLMVIYTNRCNDLKSNINNNFGMISPAGFRKVLKNLKLAEKFDIPVIFFVDSPGAFPGIHAECNCQSTIIAQTLKVLSSLKVPILSFITGEANSGGALGLIVGDYLGMLEKSLLSVISPEAFSLIVFKEKKSLEEIVSIMEITPIQNLNNGLIDEIVYGKKLDEIVKNMNKIINNKILELTNIDKETLVNERKKRIRNW
jgi:acetyl-CoA carboxylase carboxyl transferase subunit beta